MLIGLISDTHIDFHDGTLPTQIKGAFRGVDMILHAGDIWIPSVLDELETIAPVIATWGDDDMEVDLGNDTRMMRGNALHLEGISIWLSHLKPNYRLIDPDVGVYPSTHSDENINVHPDVVVFGHTHSAIIEHYKDIILVNPGSVTFPNYTQRLGTVGLLSIHSGKIEVRLIHLE
ncbi:YfcE family phosphodiesterase [Chloroflexota bacterium]